MDSTHNHSSMMTTGDGLHGAVHIHGHDHGNATMNHHAHGGGDMDMTGYNMLVKLDLY